MLSTTTRPNFMPDERFAPLRPALQERMRLIGDSITPENFAGLCDGLVANVMNDGFRRAGAHEGSIWLLDKAHEHLVISYNTGRHGSERIGKVRQSVTKGIVSMVLASEHSFVENEIFHSTSYDPTVDHSLNQLTWAMIVVPFYLLGQCRGVVSCVQVISPPDSTEPRPPGFDQSHLSSVQLLAQTVTDLIDYRMLRLTVGWAGH
ncbi:MAG: GAF domain-containing protein [Verrucomicrobia bacterium]|nr:GAF domain-containing protein [Verrucomicrobiota bacterium]